MSNWNSHKINLIESADCISRTIRKEGNIGGKLEYRKAKLLELSGLIEAAAVTGELLDALQDFLKWSEVGGIPWPGEKARSAILRANNLKPTPETER